MKKFFKAFLSVFCTASVLMTGLTVLADDTKTTPSGIAYDEIGPAIENWATENPGEYVSFVTSVFDEDEVLYEGSFGYADRENNIAADNDTVYEWGSLTKLTIWVSVMQLYEQGKIDLNADVRTYLPDGFLHNLKYDETVTMLNLMNHTAGWGEQTWALQVFGDDQIPSLEEALYQTEPPQIYRPGEVCSYSNWGAALAGYIVERISGQSYADYVHENIFEPLGMEHTSILPDHSDNMWVKQNRESLVAYNFDGTNWNENGHQLAFITVYPAGAATGTIGDLAKFAQSFVSPANPLFEKEETRDMLLSPSMCYGDTDIPLCCHGFWPDYRENVTLIGHTGGTNACSSYLAIDRETGLGMVFMTAGGNSSVTDLIFGNITAPDISSYASPVTKEGSAKGVYVSTRSIRHGIFKFFGIIDIFPVSFTGDGTYDIGGMASLDQTSDNLFVMTQGEHTYTAYSFKTSNGARVISLGSQSFATDWTFVPSIVCLSLFAIFAILGFFILVFKLIGILGKKFETYTGTLWISLSQLFRIICLLPPILLITKFTEQYGLTKTQGYVFFGVEAAGMAVFAVTLIFCIKGLLEKDIETGLRVKYILSTIGSIISIATLLLLEMLNIWGI